MDELGVSADVATQILNYLCSDNIGLTELRELPELDEAMLTRVESMLPKLKQKKLRPAIAALRKAGSSSGGGGGGGGAADAMANLSVSGGGGGGGSSGGGGLREVVDEKMTTARGNPFLYTGPVNEEGKAHGKGTAKFQGDFAGHVYEGDWVDDKMHGTGTKTKANGTVIHSGRWRNDKRA